MKYFSAGLRITAAVLVIACGAVSAYRVAAQSLSSAAVDLGSMDRTCKPCADFYQFADGGWLKAHPVQPQYSSSGVFDDLDHKNHRILQALLKHAAATKAPFGSLEQKIGDYYASCMDLAKIDQAGLIPLNDQLQLIANLTSEDQLAGVLAKLQLANADAFFGFGSSPDIKDSSSTIADLDQGGIALPDRSYYLSDDAKSVALRDLYVKHVAQIFTLDGDNAVTAAANAQTVLSIETELAKHSLTHAQRRDPYALYHPMTLAQLAALAPHFDWNAFFAGLGIPAPAKIDVDVPDFIQAFDAQIAALPLSDIRTYLRWEFLHAYAAKLSKGFVAANFDFYAHDLNGVDVQSPRAELCTSSADNNIGEAVGRLYVKKEFPPAAKIAALALVKNILATLREDIPTLTWMAPQTKTRAIQKLDAFTLKIGYPDKWRDYSSLTITRGAYAVNALAVNIFNNRRDLARIGKPTDRTRWGMTPPTVNAYYSTTGNEIVFPAGILQPPFFDPNGDMAFTYGAIGSVIGHEATHGFDDQGRQFDGKGNLVNWWTPEDAAAFNVRGQCIVDQFDALEPLPGLHEIGKQVEGEAIADLGGTTIAYKAFEKWQSHHPRKIIDGFTPEQRFFIGFAQVRASNWRPELIRTLTLTDPHPYDKFRVNATLSNLIEFAQAWNCPIGPMARPATDQCRIW